jgi:glutamyl/glutaminyl-tRNA synthetase
MSHPPGNQSAFSTYRGRLAPTPTGYLHLGHARTFWTAQQRAREQGGTLVMRNEDLDPDRCKPEFAVAMLEDLRWFGFEWQEGPDVSGPFGPYVQQERRPLYRQAWRRLHATGLIYPSPHSRKDIAEALVAPHDEPVDRAAGQDDSHEPIFPPNLRPPDLRRINDVAGSSPPSTEIEALDPGPVNWRFRVPDGEVIAFQDGRAGLVDRVAGVDFGDFLIWRKDGYPSYELAVVTDDHAMQISEVVRGKDLLTSTARQLLLYRALGWHPPAFYHCPLMLDDQGRRLAKRTDAVSLRALRAAGHPPSALRAAWTERGP